MKAPFINKEIKKAVHNSKINKSSKDFVKVELLKYVDEIMNNVADNNILEQSLTVSSLPYKNQEKQKDQ